MLTGDTVFTKAFVIVVLPEFVVVLIMPGALDEVSAVILQSLDSGVEVETIGILRKNNDLFRTFR